MNKRTAVAQRIARELAPLLESNYGLDHETLVGHLACGFEGLLISLENLDALLQTGMQSQTIEYRPGRLV